MLDVPNISAEWGAPDVDRAYVLADQATLPSDLVSPPDALGDARWDELVKADWQGLGANALEDFQSEWDWGMTVQQKADALASVALGRELDAFIGSASDAAARPPVDPGEFAGKVAEARMERARRI